jgi:hypothetical protein
MIVKVYTDIGKSKPVALYAKVVNKVRKNYKIQYLSKTNETLNGKPLYRYEDDVYDIDDDSIMEYIKTDEITIGYTPVEDGFLKEDSDSEYEMSESESESSDESLVDSEEEDQEDEYEENEE